MKAVPVDGVCVYCVTSGADHVYAYFCEIAGVNVFPGNETAGECNWQAVAGDILFKGSVRYFALFKTVFSFAGEEAEKAKDAYEAGFHFLLKVGKM